MSFKSANQKEHELSTVLQKLKRSRQFAWSWCMDKENYVIRHTGIVFYFDSRPVYTVNFGYQEGAVNTLKAAAPRDWARADPRVTIHDAPNRNVYTYFEPFESFQLKSPAHQTRARERIIAIVEYPTGSYNIVGNNCRHHVKGIVKSILGDNFPGAAEFKKKMEEVAEEDKYQQGGTMREPYWF